MKGYPKILMAIVTPQETDFPQWYQDVIAKAELADNGPVRGTMIIRPYGWGIWENIQSALDTRIKLQGAHNCYFPLFIPESYLAKEAQHIEGFAPELAVVTHGGGEKLEEPAVVRPTSETLFGTYMAKWIDSYRDLPLKLNQWVNVVRWEMRTRLFLRTSEFLWQEGHTAHHTQQEACEFARLIHRDVYHDFFIKHAAIPVLSGLKTPSERFAGANNTLTCEAMMKDGKALQIATSHELGQNFSKSFNITYLSAEGKHEHVWTTSWGASTRIMGGLIMTHGDDKGIKVPPKIAPYHAVILPIKSGDTQSEHIAADIKRELNALGIRVTISNKDGVSFGRRVTDAELKGIPIRIEIGPRDLAENKITIAHRTDSIKRLTPLAKAVQQIVSDLEQIQQILFDEAHKYLVEKTFTVNSIAEAVDAAQNGFARIRWDLIGQKGEKKLAESGITVRVLQNEDGSIPICTDDANLYAIVAKAY